VQIISPRCFDVTDFLRHSELDVFCLFPAEGVDIAGGERKKQRREEMCVLKAENDRLKAFIARKGFTREFDDELALSKESS
jgi:hypothetical protein